MKFLSRFLTIYRAFLTGTAEPTSARVDEPPAARLARFVFASNRITGGSVNLRAFMPPPDLELSTYNTDALTPDEIWRIGEAVRLEQENATLYGRADLSAKSVYDVGLRPVRDDRPARHVAIVGWPEDKASQKNKAQLLAAASSYAPR